MAGPNATTSPPRGLTAPFIAALRPAEARYEIPDRRAPGLRLRIYPTGGKLFIWRCTSRAKVYTIGPWALSEAPGVVTLDQARDWLKDLKVGHAAGTIEAVEADLRTFLRRRARVADEVVDRKAFRQVAEEFYSDDIQRNRKRPQDVRAALDRDILPVLGARQLEEITTLDVRDVVKRTVDRGAAVHAGRVLSVLKQLFSWAQANGFTDKNPAAPLRGRHLGVEVNVSDRWLTAEEIPLFWRALDEAVASDRPAAQKMRPATAAALKLLLLTAARTGELLRARWTHVDLDAATWTIPVENQKLTKTQERRAKPFVIPLPSTAVALFEILQEQADGSPWVMAGRRRRKDDQREPGHYDEKTFGHALRRLIEANALALPGGPISPHDLRRTARTHLGKLRVPPHVVERCLNHSLGRIVQTYDQGDYLEERREVLERWDVYVKRLANPGATNVVPLVEGAR
jgi:integrase